MPARRNGKRRQDKLIKPDKAYAHYSNWSNKDFHSGNRISLIAFFSACILTLTQARISYEHLVRQLLRKYPLILLRKAFLDTAKESSFFGIRMPNRDDGDLINCILKQREFSDFAFLKWRNVSPEIVIMSFLYVYNLWTEDGSAFCPSCS